MKPQKPDNSADLFRSQLSQMLNMSHPLVRLSERMNWAKLESEIDVMYSGQAGQPPLPTGLLAGLHYLKYTFNESDESVVARWVENPYWQYFCGFEYLQHELPLHPTSLTRWRNRVGDKLESLLTQTIELALETRAMSVRELDHVNVDTTVQEKAIAFPTDARLYQRMREHLVVAAEQRGIKLRQSYRKVGKKALIMQGRYSHARQMKRAAKQTRKLKTYLGRVIRDIERKVGRQDEALQMLLDRANRLHKQQRQDKNKLYSAHAEEVECIAKGKVHKRYEFGNKASFVTTSKNNWVVGAQSLKGNPYDGHTLKSALEQVQDVAGRAAKTAYCDQGYRGHGVEGETTVKVVGRLPKRATRTTRNWMKRRAAIEPVIGHLKSDNRLSRNYLKGDVGNRANVLLAAAGYNLAKLLAWFYCAWAAVMIVKKPPAAKGHSKGGSCSNPEHPVQKIILIMRHWVNSKEKLLSARHPYG
jgi:IS5 family transposase